MAQHPSSNSSFISSPSLPNTHFFVGHMCLFHLQCIIIIKSLVEGVENMLCITKCPDSLAQDCSLIMTAVYPQYYK